MASVGTIKYKNGSSWIDILHPVNSFYISYASTSPASLFGGTWTQITGAVLRGNTNVGYTGSDSHTLSVNEMPKHTHGMERGLIYDNGSWFKPTDGLAHPDNGAGQNTPFGNGHVEMFTTGGGQHTQSCNAPSTAISGIALRKSKRVM